MQEEPKGPILLSTVRDFGGKAGNVSLRRHLAASGWDDETYWRVRDELLRKGEIILFRCRGGGVALKQSPVAEDGKSKEKEPVGGEARHYDELAEILRDQWCKDLDFEDFIVEITARQGGKITGGAWTRPDIVVVNVGTFRHVPGKHLDVITFEVKEAHSADVKAVHEASAHLRAATKAYLLIVGKLDEEQQERIKLEAQRQGIGIILVPESKEHAEWEYPVDPKQQIVDPANIDEFIEIQLSQKAARKIERWSK